MAVACSGSPGSGSAACTSPCSPAKVDRECRRHDRQNAGDQSPQPRPHAEVQKTFHHDLARHGPGKGRRLARAEQRNREENARQLVPSSGASSKCACWISVTTMSALEKHRSGQDQDGGVHKQRAIQRHDGIDQVEPASGALFRFALADTPRLHQGRMQIEVMGHHRRAQDADRDVEAFAVQPRDQAGDDLAKSRAWPRKSRLRNTPR